MLRVGWLRRCPLSLPRFEIIQHCLIPYRTRSDWQIGALDHVHGYVAFRMVGRCQRFHLFSVWLEPSISLSKHTAKTLRNACFLRAEFEFLHNRFGSEPVHIAAMQFDLLLALV